MNVIKQIISDIQHLKNIENYVIILSAVILIMTDIFGEPNSDWLTEATLGVLALLAIDRIQSKRLLENVNLSLQDVRRGHYFEKSNEVEDFARQWDKIGTGLRILIGESVTLHEAAAWNHS